MKISGNTILITGGTSGIGLELAKQLTEQGNTIIVTGRDQAKLQAVQQKLPEAHVYQSDVSDDAAIAALYTQVTSDFPDLNMLINNAGIMRMLNLASKKGPQQLDQEIDINLLGPIRMVEKFLPFLMAKPAAAIVNVSSGLAFIPLATAPVYSATKAGMHFYTQSLRVQLSGRAVKVFELAPPPTGTALLDNFGSESSNSSTRGTMPTDKMVGVAIKGLSRDKYEIRPGVSNVLKVMSRLAPKFLFNQISKPTAKELAKAHL